MPSYAPTLSVTATSNDESPTRVARNWSTSDGVADGLRLFGKIKLPRTRSVRRLSERDRQASEMNTTLGIADCRASATLSSRLTASFGLSGANDSIQCSE